VVWRVDVAYLKKEDWKYEKSAAGEGGGGRTHTFGVRVPERNSRGARHIAEAISSFRRENRFQEMAMVKHRHRLCAIFTTFYRVVQF
jgi:hypothetical protein